jgi:hypothetical protein
MTWSLIEPRSIEQGRPLPEQGVQAGNSRAFKDAQSEPTHHRIEGAESNAEDTAKP